MTESQDLARWYRDYARDMHQAAQQARKDGRPDIAICNETEARHAEKEAEKYASRT